MALGAFEKQVMRLQFIQIYFAQNRCETLKQLHNYEALTNDYKSLLGINEFNRIFEFVIEQFSNNKFNLNSTNNNIFDEFFNNFEVNLNKFY